MARALGQVLKKTEMDGIWGRASSVEWHLEIRIGIRIGVTSGRKKRRGQCNVETSAKEEQVASS